MSVAQRAARTPRPAPVPRVRAARPPLRAVPPQRQRASRGLFIVVVAAVLTLGLITLLGLNTLLAQGSFTVHDLENQVAELSDQQSALEEEVAEIASPRRLADKARAIGMVQAENPAFLRTSDGVVLGEPKAGVAAPPAPEVLVP